MSFVSFGRHLQSASDQSGFSRVFTPRRPPVFSYIPFAPQYEYSGGDFGDDYDPREDCDSNPGPTPTPPTPSPTPPTPSPLTPTPSEAPTPHTPSPTDDSGSEEPEYLGCFLSYRGNRAVNFGYRDLEDMTNEVGIEGHNYSL